MENIRKFKLISKSISCYWVDFKHVFKLTLACIHLCLKTTSYIIHKPKTSFNF